MSFVCNVFYFYSLEFNVDLVVFKHLKLILLFSVNMNISNGLIYLDAFCFFSFFLQQIPGE